jgi:pectate lyase
MSARPIARSQAWLKAFLLLGAAASCSGSEAGKEQGGGAEGAATGGAVSGRGGSGSGVAGSAGALAGQSGSASGGTPGGAGLGGSGASGATSGNGAVGGSAGQAGQAGDTTAGANAAGAGGASAGGASGGDGGGTAGSGMAGAGNPEDVVAFPGAEGFGKDARGGRGGSVCHVTTLADSGAGSLRECVSQSNRTVVFDVSGWIDLSSNLGVTENNITIAGQTAPGNGVGVRGRKFSIGGSHVVVRYLRMRRGILLTTDRDDAMTISSDASDVIVDHCSVSYGTDENLSMPGDEGRGPRNLTLQWSIVAWGLQRDNHSAGSLFTSNLTTIHHTLWAFNKTRNPRCRSEEASNRGQGGHSDWVNNVIYGWNAQDPVGEERGFSLSYDPFILAGTENGQHSANAVGNYFISRRNASYAFHNGTSNFRLYVSDNVLDGNANGMVDSSKTGTDMIEGSPTLLDARLEGPEVATDTPQAAYDKVLAGVGVTVPARDEADTLLISQVMGQTGNLIQNETDLVALGVGDSGYGTLPEEERPAGFDTDQDGMPDAWEAANGLDPGDASDRNDDADGDAYTNLEEYLNSLAR